MSPTLEFWVSENNGGASRPNKLKAKSLLSAKREASLKQAFLGTDLTVYSILSNVRDEHNIMCEEYHPLRSHYFASYKGWSEKWCDTQDPHDTAHFY